MRTKTRQEIFWAGTGGASYLERNFDGGGRYEERKAFYDLFNSFDKDISILEVGCNCGINLQILDNLGFTNLSGLEIGAPALAEAQKRLPNVNFHLGSLLELPFENRSFDVIFSSGVLIHQNPENSLPTAMAEMIRCSNKYILGIEDYSSETISCSYRGSKDFYWRAPFLSVWKSFVPFLEVEEECFIDAPGSSGTYQRQCYKIIIP